MADLKFEKDGKPLVVKNVPIKNVEKVTKAVAAKTVRQVSAEKILESVRKFQTGTVDATAESKPIVKPAKAKKEAKTVATKRGRGDNNPKRARAVELMTKLEADGVTQDKILETVQAELKLTYANAYYYWARVYKKA